jgi:glycosyltransferase involved in cell wall biosynthesis
MKIIHLNQSDTQGGAAIAAYRVHKSLLKQNIDSVMWVEQKFSEDSTVKLKLNLFEKFSRKVFVWISYKFYKFLGLKNLSYFNAGIFGSSWIRHLNKSDADIIHLHWLGNEILSMKQINNIKKPCIVTLHDEWLIGDGYHITLDQNQKINKRLTKYFIKYVRHIKNKHYRESINLIAPSNFIANLVSNHSKYKENQLKIIGHPILEDDWVSINKVEAKKIIGLSKQCFSIFFSSFGGSDDLNKGFYDFCEAVKLFANHNTELNICLIIVGNFDELALKKIGLPYIFMGIIENRDELIASYCASDVVVLPSRYESFGLVAQEVCMLGIPIVAYEDTGIKDFVSHKVNGYLAKKNSFKDISAGISYWSKKSTKNLSNLNRTILKKYSPSIIARTHIDFYKKIISKSK